jgi:hypothetical protein
MVRSAAELAGQVLPGSLGGSAPVPPAGGVRFQLPTVSRASEPFHAGPYIAWILLAGLTWLSLCVLSIGLVLPLTLGRVRPPHRTIAPFSGARAPSRPNHGNKA